MQLGTPKAHLKGEFLNYEHSYILITKVYREDMEKIAHSEAKKANANPRKTFYYAINKRESGQLVKFF